MYMLINLCRWSKVVFHTTHPTEPPLPSNIQLMKMVFMLKVPTFLRRPLSQKPLEERSRQIHLGPMMRSTTGNLSSRDSVDQHTMPIHFENFNFIIWSVKSSMIHPRHNPACPANPLLEGGSAKYRYVLSHFFLLPSL